MEDIILSPLAAQAAEALKSNPTFLDEVVNTEEAARIIGNAPVTLRRWRVSGDGPPYVKINASVGYIRRDLLEYIAARRRRSTSEQAA